MARDKAKDDKYFNCGEEHEKKYVSSLYDNKTAVYNFLVSSCANGKISYSTHMKVYQLIKENLGYPIPA